MHTVCTTSFLHLLRVSAVGSGERSHEEVCPGATVSGRGERLETQFTSSSSAGRPQPFQGV